MSLINKIFPTDYKKLLELIPDNSIDAVITDPPYNITEAKWDNIDVIDSYWWKQMERITKPNSAIIIFACHPFTNKLFTEKPKKWKYYQLIWVKSRFSDFLNAGWKPPRRHEEIFVFYRKRTTYNPQYTEGEPYVATSASKASDLYRLGIDNHTTINNGTRVPTTVLEFASVNGPHPTQKPVKLLEWLINTYSNPGEVVYDPFMGSGTTAEAAVNTKRKFIGTELDPKYYDITIKRVFDALTRENKITVKKSKTLVDYLQMEMF